MTDEIDSPSSQTQDRVLVFDTTLRDGEQAPGCSMSQTEKIRVAKTLAEMKVDVIEAGFPAASRGDWESVNAVAQQVEGATICGLARCQENDIRLAARALKPAPRHRLHVFLATSEIHRKFKLNMAREQILAAAVDGVRRARDLCDDVEFSPEDASRTELEFLAQVVERAIEAGASTVNIPDTVGYSVPEEFSEIIRYLKKYVRGIERIRLSVHCHDDLGLAVANSLSGILAGARQVECTINGIGERAGNCSLEEVVMAVKTREAFFSIKTGVCTNKLYPAARLVASITGMPIARNKAVVGENAFSHEAGIHQHGMLMNRSTYEILRPEDVGVPQSRIVLGKHSGRHAFSQRVKELGFKLTDAELARAFEGFKALADRKKHLFDGDIEALVLRQDDVSEGPWILLDLDTIVHSGRPAIAAVHLSHRDGRAIRQIAEGDGPVDAAFKAVEAATECQFAVRKVEIHSVSEGEDAQGEAIIYGEYDQRSYRASGLSTDIVEASIIAYLQIVNTIVLRGAALSRAAKAS